MGRGQQKKVNCWGAKRVRRRDAVLPTWKQAFWSSLLARWHWWTCVAVNVALLVRGDGSVFVGCQDHGNELCGSVMWEDCSMRHQPESYPGWNQESSSSDEVQFTDQGNAKAQFKYDIQLLQADDMSMNKSFAAHDLELSVDQGNAQSQFCFVHCLCTNVSLSLTIESLLASSQQR